MKTVVACSEIQNICAVSCGVCIPLSPSPPSPSRCTGSNTFADKASLKTAVTEYNWNAAAATAKYGPIAGWCVSRVTDMGKLFFNMYHFNEDISSWDTSRVTNMHAMFWSGFNHPLSFDTSRVTDMSAMFQHNEWFNQPLHLDTSRVTNMASMFNGAHAFNQPLSFDTSRVTNMVNMFFVRSSPCSALPICSRALSPANAACTVVALCSAPPRFSARAEPACTLCALLATLGSQSAKNFNQQLRFDLSSVPNTGSMFYVCTPPRPAP